MLSRGGGGLLLLPTILIYRSSQRCPLPTVTLSLIHPSAAYNPCQSFAFSLSLSAKEKARSEATSLGYHRYYTNKGGFSVSMEPKPWWTTGLLIIEASPSHSDTPQSVVLLRTSDRLAAEASTWKHTQQSQQTDRHVPGGVRTRNPSKRATAHPRLRRRCHWDRHLVKWSVTVPSTVTGRNQIPRSSVYCFSWWKKLLIRLSNIHYEEPMLWLYVV